MAGRSANAAYPIVAICCLGFILFAIAATIVLALIPVYLSTRSITASSITSHQKTLNYTVSSSGSTFKRDLGSSRSDQLSSNTSTIVLSSSEIAQISSFLQSSQTASTLSNGGLTVIYAEIDNGDVLFLIILLFGRDTAALNLVQNLLSSFIVNKQSAISSLVTSILSSTTISGSLVSTTVNSAVLSTTAATGRRRRNIHPHRQAYKTALNTYKD